MKPIFKLTDVGSAEKPKKKVTGSQRNAFLREQLQTTARMTGATVPADPKQLAKDYPSAVLEEALKLRRKQEARDYAKTPRMRHFTRDNWTRDGKGPLREWSRAYDGSLDTHVCISECGMYNDAEIKALFDKEVRAALEILESFLRCVVRW